MVAPVASDGVPDAAEPRCNVARCDGEHELVDAIADFGSDCEQPALQLRMVDSGGSDVSHVVSSSDFQASALQASSFPLCPWFVRALTALAS